MNLLSWYFFGILRKKLVMRFLILFIFSFSFLGCYQVERNCSDFKTGKFEFEAMAGTEMLYTTVIRNDTIEVDYFEGKADTSSIRWINDCEYIIKKLHPKNQAEKKAIHIKILSTKNNEYTFEFREVGQSKGNKGKARKIDD